jgi:hypothetical protein
MPLVLTALVLVSLSILPQHTTDILKLFLIVLICTFTNIVLIVSITVNYLINLQF